MLQLPQVTLFAIDCVNPGRTARAMGMSMRWVRFGKALLLTDTRRFPKVDPLPPGVRVIHREQSNAKAVPCAGHKPVAVDYERDILRLPAEYCETDFLLNQEWDSGVVNHEAWSWDFLNYDFIGAPWVPHCDPGWPRCDESNNVGNGGFSLRSKKFCDLVKQSTEEFKGNREMLISDSWFSRSIRPWLEERGVRFAPEALALRFSCENRIYSGQFGFHGSATIAINGWKWG